MKHNYSLSAFTIPSLTAAIVSGVVTAAGLSLAQDSAATMQPMQEHGHTMQYSKDMQPRYELIDGGMKEPSFMMQPTEQSPEMHGAPMFQNTTDMRMNPLQKYQLMQPDMGMKKEMYPFPTHTGEQNVGFPSSFGQGMNMPSYQDQSSMNDQHKKQLIQAIKKAEKMQLTMARKFDKQILRMKKKYDRAIKKMDARLAKLTDEDERLDMKDAMEEMMSDYKEMVEDLTEQHEERMEDLAYAIEDLQDQLADSESDDSAVE